MWKEFLLKISAICAQINVEDERKLIWKRNYLSEREEEKCRPKAKKNCYIERQRPKEINEDQSAIEEFAACPSSQRWIIMGPNEHDVSLYLWVNGSANE